MEQSAYYTDLMDNSQTEFVQIGNIALNPAQIVTVDFGDNRVWIDLVASGEIDTDSQLVLEGANACAFRAWWNGENVRRFEPEWYEGEE